jgi:hypothetical protein
VNYKSIEKPNFRGISFFLLCFIKCFLRNFMGLLVQMLYPDVDGFTSAFFFSFSTHNPTIDSYFLATHIKNGM